MSAGRFVAYYRVSTKRQDQSGLDLEAQQAAVRDHLNGGRWQLVAEVVEVESGKRNDRPKLQEALALCRLHGAALIIAKLDRLARNVAFVSQLMDGDVDFIAGDFPQANRLTVHILAAVAEHEREAISARTKAALAAAKARGVRLGNDGSNLANRAVGASKGTASRKAKASQRARDVMPVINLLRKTGVIGLRRIAAALNERSIPAARGGKWSPVQVRRVIRRSE